MNTTVKGAKKMNSILLHLSDIHLRGEDDPIIGRVENIAASIVPYLPRAGNVIIVVSGDIAFSGKESEYKAAAGFLARIKEAIRAEKPVPVSYVLVPGNHDCDFEQQTGARGLCVDALKMNPDQPIDISVGASGNRVES